MVMGRSGVAVLAAIAVAVLAACSVGSDRLPTGQSSVNVNGGELAFWCEGSGSPTVVIEQGLFGQRAPFDPGDWYGWAQPLLDISEFTHVCVYNRRGVPDSDPVEDEEIRTIQDQVDDLHALVETLGLGQPLVMVGHSWGGLLVQLFTAQHLDSVAGLVLVDSTHRSQNEVFDVAPPDPMTPEWVDIAKSMALAGTVSDLGDLPLIVLDAGLLHSTGSEEDETNIKKKRDLQKDLATLSTNSEYILLTDSGHNMMIYRPDAIVDAVQTIVDKVG
jgi:pimeloyl-ACP methyl ester carboxylesterase